MNIRQLLQLALDPSRILAARGLAVDPWQRDVLLSDNRQLLLNCCRQAGKSTVVSALALHHALFQPGSLTLIVSPGLRQSAETFKKVRDGYRVLGRPIKATHESQVRLELANASRILCLPGVEGTIRCYSPTLLIVDEAARVADDLYRSIRPMLAVSRGRLVALSTPFGQRGWFFDAWHGSGPWQRICVPWRQCPRITAEFIAEEERAMGRDVGGAGIRMLVRGAGGAGLSRLRPGAHEGASAGRRAARRRHRLGLAQSVRGGLGRARPRRRAVDCTTSATCARRRCTSTPRRCRGASCGTPTRPVPRRDRRVSCGRPSRAARHERHPPGDRCRHRPAADRPAQGRSAPLPIAVHRGDAVPLSVRRRARAARREPDRRAQPRAGGAAVSDLDGSMRGLSPGSARGVQRRASMFSSAHFHNLGGTP